jgi:hypothetical protein
METNSKKKRFLNKRENILKGSRESKPAAEYKWYHEQ